MDEPRGSRWDGGSLECWIGIPPVDCGRMNGGSRGRVGGGMGPGGVGGMVAPSCVASICPRWTAVY